jgi:pyruvate kinase
MPPMLTKIVATLGPASDSPELVRKLIDAGVGVFRLNFSHGTLDDHARRLATVRAAAKELHRPTGVLGDLQGPKIRVGLVPDPGIELDTGCEVVIRHSVDPLEPASRTGNRVTLTTAYEPVVGEVEPGQRVLINDGAVRLLAIDRRTNNGQPELVCRVTVGGLVTSKKGINLPDSAITAPALTERDMECVQWAVAQGLDLLALSFVRRADEVRALKRHLAQVCPIDRDADPLGVGSHIPVIAKLERPQAVEQPYLDEIVQSADAVMVARGDLGVEMDLARVPIVQKRIIECAANWGKPCIVATQMLESMITSPLPTRAEVSDVANAILDGAGAVMLSAETATGKHPLLAVEYMRLAALAAEEELAARRNNPSPPARLVESHYRTAALAHGAWHTARDLSAKAVACWSQRGGAARYLSENNFAVPILAFSSDVRETRRMQLLRGVFPVRADPPASLAEFNRLAERELLARNFVVPGDPVVLLAGLPLGEHGATNTMAIHYTSNPVTGFMRHSSP